MSDSVTTGNLFPETNKKQNNDRRPLPVRRHRLGDASRQETRYPQTLTLRATGARL